MLCKKINCLYHKYTYILLKNVSKFLKCHAVYPVEQNDTIDVALIFQNMFANKVPKNDSMMMLIEKLTSLMLQIRVS